MSRATPGCRSYGQHFNIWSYSNLFSTAVMSSDTPPYVVHFSAEVGKTSFFSDFYPN